MNEHQPAQDQPASSTLKTLTTVGYLEGTSFLLLLCIAMPLKYMMGIPEGVKYIGMAHGVLFIAYIVILMGAANKIKMPIWAMPAGVMGSFLPFGPFIFDHLLKKSLNKTQAATQSLPQN
jgi:integral membrane protein